ncbi:MAG TPA: hypothetical protein VGP02_06560 [Mycobacteriales bacterium]|jgi:hypothetical protein|nr:hypothetical protein [Mycobacteriales bacterium]
MTQPPRDAAHAAEVPGLLPEYGNDTGFAEGLLDPVPEPEAPDEEDPDVTPD